MSLDNRIDSLPDASPIFVLCGARTGSTLLRFLIDTHPEIACPPETNIPALCSQIATVWSLVAGAPLSAERGEAPPNIPAEAIVGVRNTIDSMVGPYLSRRGKSRYCDKSLSSASYAELLVRIYPDARFICLYRHPMDMIASGIEACPWGVGGYGFDPYVSQTPGNTVLALARCWQDNTTEILEVEDKYPSQCLRVRYEDLVFDPAKVMGDVFGFVGASNASGTYKTLSMAVEDHGPGDYKIWHSAEIHRDSVGRGWSIPSKLIPMSVVQAINELAGKLGYIPIDDAWGTAERPEDVRLTTDDIEQDRRETSKLDPIVERCAHLVADTIQTRLGEADRRATSPGIGFPPEVFVAVIAPETSARGGAMRVRADLTSGTVQTSPVQSILERDGSAIDGGPNSDWDVVGSANSWLSVLSGDLNLGVALRHCNLRYCEASDSGPLNARRRLSVLAELLGGADRKAQVSSAGR